MVQAPAHEQSMVQCPEPDYFSQFQAPRAQWQPQSHTLIIAGLMPNHWLINSISWDWLDHRLGHCLGHRLDQ